MWLIGALVGAFIGEIIGHGFWVVGAVLGGIVGLAISPKKTVPAPPSPEILSRVGRLEDEVASLRREIKAMRVHGETASAGIPETSAERISTAQALPEAVAQPAMQDKSDWEPVRAPYESHEQNTPPDTAVAGTSGPDTFAGCTHFNAKMTTSIARMVSRQARRSSAAV